VKNEETPKKEFKARLVARGFQQSDSGKPYDIFSPVVKLTTLRLMLALSTQFDFYFHQMDVTSAFLNGEIEEEIYLSKPLGMRQDGKLLKLHKSLYGLKRSPRNWNNKFNEFMLEENFVRSKNDYCLYIKIQGGSNLYCLLYVDDLLIFANSVHLINNLKGKLSSKFKMKDFGNEINYLGIKIVHDRLKGVLYLDQSCYLWNVLKRFDMSSCKPNLTPLAANCNIVDSEPSDQKYIHKCRQIIDSLMYSVL